MTAQELGASRNGVVPSIEQKGGLLSQDYVIPESGACSHTYRAAGAPVTKDASDTEDEPVKTSKKKKKWGKRVGKSVGEVLGEVLGALLLAPFNS